MRYKLKLSRSTETLDVVEIPMDFNLKIGDIILVNGNHHELKMIIRSTIPSNEMKNNGFTPEQIEKALPTLIIGDSFPLL